MTIHLKKGLSVLVVMIPTALGLLCEATAQSRATVNIRLNDTINSGGAQAGDSFTGTLDGPLVVGNRAVVVIGWPQRVERLTFDGDDLDDILQPLSARTNISIEILRPRIHVKQDDD